MTDVDPIPHLEVQALGLDFDDLPMDQANDALHLIRVIELAEPAEVRQQRIDHALLSESLQLISVPNFARRNRRTSSKLLKVNRCSL